MFHNPLGSLTVRLWAFVATLLLVALLFDPAGHNLPNWVCVSTFFTALLGTVVILLPLLASWTDGQRRAEQKIVRRFYPLFRPDTSIQQVVKDELKKTAQEKRAIETINHERAAKLKREFEMLLKLAKKARLFPEDMAYNSFFA